MRFVFCDGESCVVDFILGLHMDLATMPFKLPTVAYIQPPKRAMPHEDFALYRNFVGDGMKSLSGRRHQGRGSRQLTLTRQSTLMVSMHGISQDRSGPLPSVLILIRITRLSNMISHPGPIDRSSFTGEPSDPPNLPSTNFQGSSSLWTSHATQHRQARLSALTIEA